MAREYNLDIGAAPRELQINYAAELNAQQYEAVTAAPGPALVIAGAGSGKTRTLTYRVSYLIEHGVSAERILLLTFTNKAASEMMRRVNDLLGNDLGQLWGGTFHSIGNRVLRRHIERLGYRRDFTIMDREDATDLVKACIDESNIDVAATRFPKGDVVADIFSMALNTGHTIKETLAAFYDHFSELGDELEKLMTAYGARKKRDNVLDFDDLLWLWLKLLKEDAEVREHQQQRFRHILVDEYQDTNTLQGELIDLLAEKHRNVMVVGDDSQSIYSWRGANFKNIIDFPKRYTDARVYKIETNYRSSPEILELANAVIAHNTAQYPKHLVSAVKSGPKPASVVCDDADIQSHFVAQRVLELRDEGIPLNEMAVLYRSHFHAMELQFALTKRNIPFQITSGLRFQEQAHVKDLTAFLKLIHNPQDELAFKRIVRMLRGIGGKSADKLWQEYQKELAGKLALIEETPVPDPDLSWSEAVEAPSAAEGADPDWSVDDEPPSPSTRLGFIEAQGLARTLQACSKVVPKKAQVDFANLTTIFAQMDAPDVRDKPAALLTRAMEGFYEDYLKETYTNYRTRQEDLSQLINMAHQFTSAAQFLTELALVGAEPEDGRGADRERDEERLRLSTIHQAKGLEYSAVFIIMLADGMFPASRSLTSPENEEEERRLFYVAVTRARRELYLSYPILRLSQGEAKMQIPSRFVQEIPKDLVEEWKLNIPRHHSY